MPMLIGFLRMEAEAYAERAAGVLSVEAKSTSPGLVWSSHCGELEITC
jgi:hypothetical protein